MKVSSAIIKNRVLEQMNKAGNKSYPFNHINQLKRPKNKLVKNRNSVFKNEQRSRNISDGLIKIACCCVLFCVSLLAVSLTINAIKVF